MSESQSFTLSVPRGIALYVGALLGPGLLLLPGLAARQAGPASIVAWAGLLGVSALFAVVFAAMGRAHPRANGVAGYAAAGLGATAGRVVGWCFLTGVIGGAPVVCLIGAGYVTSLTGGGLVARGLVAAALLLVVLALALGGVRASSTAQLVLVALLIVIIALAVGGSAPAARAGHWTPFAPDGWSAIGRAAATLMLSFVGWEAVAPLTTRFRNPDRDLPRVIGAAFGVTAVLYLALAVTTIAVLGPAAGTDVPLARLLVRAVGQAGQVAAAVAAVVLTIGAVNAYLSGAAAMARRLTEDARGGDGAGSEGGAGNRLVLAACTLVGLVVIALYTAKLVNTTQLIGLPTTLFLVVYLGCTVSAGHTLRGWTRAAAVVAALAVLVVLAFCGWPLVLAGLVAGTAVVTGRRQYVTSKIWMAVQAPRWMMSPGLSGTGRPGGISRPLSRVPFSEPGSITAIRPPSAATRTACRRDTPGSVGGPVRSISGSMPRETLRRPMRTSRPLSRNRRRGQYTGNRSEAASSPPCATTESK
jgi:amino acid efflux transporter